MNYDIMGATVVGTKEVTGDTVEVYLRPPNGEVIALYGDVEGLNTTTLPTLYTREEDLPPTKRTDIDMSDEGSTRIAHAIESAVNRILSEEGFTDEKRNMFWNMWRSKRQ